MEHSSQVPCRDDLIHAILEVLAGSLVEPPAGEIADSTLDALGIDSLTVVRVLADCEDRLGIEIDVELLDLEDVRTAREFSVRVTEACIATDP